MEVQKVEQEDVPNQEEPQLVFPKVVAPKVLLEILIPGTYKEGTEPKDSAEYKEAIELQKQIDNLRGKDKYRVRILWKTIESDQNNEILSEKEDEMYDWLVENSSCKYYVYGHLEENFIKNCLKSIKRIENELETFKYTGIVLKRK
jgi:hypothetical protein